MSISKARHSTEGVAVLMELGLGLPALVSDLEYLVVLALGVLDDLVTCQIGERHRVNCLKKLSVVILNFVIIRKI